ncbi:hypothetical protein [Iamia sp.]|uniref:hypothetical protein n=1 Tax=Iamia sp. TaxID=2722710 RepID=UPI002CA50114|nr:hypothetical protein [Iamia sp.]HXH55872.1 hypothetical protein [Iamia sp.]
MAQDVGSGKSRRGLPVELGGALVTLVEPHAGHEVAYNRWYERDHFYAGCMLGAWTISGARFVATRGLKDLRAADSTVAPDPLDGSYLSLYWIAAGKFGEWMDWGTRQVKWLIDEDRMFPHREHTHTVMYRFHSEIPGRDDAVPVELALDHRSPSLVMTVVDRAGGVDSAAVAEWWGDRHLGAEVTAVLEPVPMPGDAPSDVPVERTGDRTLLLAFVDHDVAETWADRWADLPAGLAEAGLGSVAFLSPFTGTIPGTDTYADQLR